VFCRWVCVTFGECDNGACGLSEGV
jgi:hypothetical protein